jgi:hypothetical protein
MSTPALSLAELRRKPHWSHSALNAILNVCSLQWAFRSLWRVPPAFTPATLLFGSVFHSACSFAFRARLAGGPLPLVPTLDLFGDLLSQECRLCDVPVRFRDGESLDAMILQGRTMLKALLMDPLSSEGRVLSVGEVFCVPLPGDGSTEPKPLIGEYDLVLEDAEGTILVDWKTAARRWPEGKADLDLQPTCYLYAQARNDPVPARFRFDVVTKTATPTVVHLETARDEDRFRRLEALVEVVERLVQAECFLPSEQSFACSDCPYGEACAAWHRSRERVSVGFSRAA